MPLKPIDPALLFLASGIKQYYNVTNRKLPALLEHTLDREWTENPFHWNRISDFLSSREATAILDWAIAEVCMPFVPHVDRFIVDGTGISLSSRGHYRQERYGESMEVRSRRFVRLHLVMERRFKFFPVALVTPESGAGSGEQSQVEYLLRRLAALGFRPGQILADRGYSSESILQLIVELGAEPVIAFKSIYSRNRLPAKDLMRKLYLAFLADPEGFQEKYRDRPLIEAGISALKRKFVEAVRGRTHRTRVNEVLYKVLCHNIDVLIHAAIEFGFDVDRLLKSTGDRPGRPKAG